MCHRQIHNGSPRIRSAELTGKVVKDRTQPVSDWKSEHGSIYGKDLFHIGKQHADDDLKIIQRRIEENIHKLLGIDDGDLTFGVGVTLKAVYVIRQHCRDPEHLSR